MVVARRSSKPASTTLIKALNTVTKVTPPNYQKPFGERKTQVKTPVLNEALWHPLHHINPAQKNSCVNSIMLNKVLLWIFVQVIKSLK